MKLALLTALLTATVTMALALPAPVPAAPADLEKREGRVVRPPPFGHGWQMPPPVGKMTANRPKAQGRRDADVDKAGDDAIVHVNADVYDGDEGEDEGLEEALGDGVEELEVEVDVDIAGVAGEDDA